MSTAKECRRSVYEENTGWWVFENLIQVWGERGGNKMITCSPAVVGNLSAREGPAKGLGRPVASVSGRGSMRIGDTGMQAMREVVAAAADPVHAAGTVAPRRTGCAKIQQSLEGDNRFGVAAIGHTAGVEIQQVAGTAPERVRVWSG